MAAAESPIPDERLVDAVLAGDELAFAELAGRHKNRVFGLASRFARNGADLEDICQDVFIQAFFKLGQFRRESPFEHWILRIATYKCYDYLRRRRRDNNETSVDALLATGYQPAAPADPAPHPDLERLHAALAELSAKERLVVTLLELEDRSVEEVARLTGWSAGNVKVRAFRARATLRKLLQRVT
jgi:RNA polymerase sigma-70 factor (ECF subfamily)